MLFLHIWASTVYVKGEVSDDAIPTHETVEGGQLVLRTDVQARYWITADLDCVIMVIPYLNYDRILYLGLLEPVGTHVDETYHSVASDDDMVRCSILRRWDGLWDRDLNNAIRVEYDNIHSSRHNLEMAITPVYCSSLNFTSGQYKHIGCTGPKMGLQPHDLIVSTHPGATSEWTVFSPTSGFWLCVQTAGVAPGDLTDGAAFAYWTGAAANATAVITAVTAHLTGIGWNDLGMPGVWLVDRLYYSTGEDGNSDIYVHFGYEANFFMINVWDDALGTHISFFSRANVQAGWFPVQVYIAADLDCMAIGLKPSVVVDQKILWAGKTVPIFPSLDGFRLIGNYAWQVGSTTSVLLDQQGTWQVVGTIWNGATIGATSSPNIYDGTTYVLWPFILTSAIDGAGTPFNPAGMMKYVFYVDDAGALVSMDTITVGAEVFTVLAAAGSTLAIRSV
jgi:hypothetical protein